ncbi:MAG: sporulation protein YqfD [Candidatus Faecivicinus sp.]
MNGDVRLRVEGLMLERLIQRALNEGARFKSIRRDGARAMIIDADPESASILSALCERFSLHCKVLSRRGRDAMLRRLRQRATLLAGLLTCIVTVSLFFSRVWLIDVELTGGRVADVRELKDSLASLGIRPGMAKSTVETGLLEDALSAASPDFSFVGVKLQGIRLLVQASPAVPAPELYELEDGRDLVAKCDGIIQSIRVLSGVACVQPGDTVLRGQVLIRGDERVTKEENRSIAALGEVIARTWCEGSAELPTTREEQIRTGRSSLTAELRLMSLAWPLTEGESYPSQEIETELLPIGGLFLPLEIHRFTAYETRSHSVENDPETLRQQLAQLAWAAAGIQLTQSHPDGCEIVDRWIEYTQSAGVLHARAVYETQTDIAVTRDVLYQQGG